VRFAADLAALAELAAPLARWWQNAGPQPNGQVLLRFVGPNGVTELAYCVPDIAVKSVRHLIVSESGRFYGPGEAPGPMRRFAARVVRSARAGFTATILRVEDAGGPLVVALAGRDLDDEPRELEFQGPDEDDDYCVLNEMRVPVYAGLAALKLSRTALHVRLTAEAAQEWRLRSPRMAIKLKLSRPQHNQLRAGLLRLFTHNAGRSPTPEMDLGEP
jgi:hypothetical protein